MDSTLEHKNFESFLKQAAYNQEFPTIWQFPKEFKRNWFRQIDFRFMIILLLTFIAEVATILILLSWIKNRDKYLDVNSIQKRYANLLLDKHSQHTFAEEALTKGTYLYGVSDEKSQATKQHAVDKNDSRVYADISQSINSRVDKIDQSNAGQLIADKTSKNGSSGSAADIGTIGLLQYLSDKNIGSNQELQELYAQSDLNYHYLEGSLSNAKLGNYKDHGGGSAPSGSGIETTAFISGAKGTKSKLSSVAASSTVAPLEKASYSTGAKNTELEESSAIALNKTGSKAAPRNAEHVTRIVLNHNRSIQDCYKQALKKQPNIKGKVVVRFSVTPMGTVNRVEVIASTIDHEPMITCIINKIYRWNDFGESDIALGTVSYRQTYLFGY